MPSPEADRPARARVVWVLASVGLSLLLAEGFLRLFFPQPTLAQRYRDVPRIAQESPTLPYALRPGSRGRLRSPEFDVAVSINAQGYRGPDFSPGKGRRWRILAIGDSFTFGHGVEDGETYPSRLGALLGDEAEVINAGFASGYAPDTYYLYLKTDGLVLRPDVVLVGFFIGNDIDHPLSDENEWLAVDAQGLPLRIRNRYVMISDGYGISRDIQFRYRVPVLRDSHLFQLAIEAAMPVLPDSLKGDRIARLNRDIPAYTYIYRPEYPPRTQALVEQVRRLFLAMSALAREASSALVVVMIPELGQVDPTRILGGTPPVPIDLEKPQREFSEWFRAHEIRYVDLLPVMRAGGPGLYFPVDRHWTRAGHQLAAEVLARYLEAAGLAGPRPVTRP
jgi:hypothetical protein